MGPAAWARVEVTPAEKPNSIEAGFSGGGAIERCRITIRRIAW